MLNEISFFAELFLRVWTSGLFTEHDICLIMNHSSSTLHIYPVSCHKYNRDADKRAAAIARSSNSHEETTQSNATQSVMPVRHHRRVNHFNTISLLKILYNLIMQCYLVLPIISYLHQR